MGSTAHTLPVTAISPTVPLLCLIVLLQAQEQLLEVPWPAKLLEHSYCAPLHLGAACMAKDAAHSAAAAALEAAGGAALKDQGPRLMAGLRVRMGVNTGALHTAANACCLLIRGARALDEDTASPRYCAGFGQHRGCRTCSFDWTVSPGINTGLLFIVAHTAFALARYMAEKTRRSPNVTTSCMLLAAAATSNTHLL